MTIVAGALGIAWQVARQHKLQGSRDIEAELKLVSDLQQFLVFADHYLGRIAGASLFGDTYVKYLSEDYRRADFGAVAQVFAETHSRDIPGPLLKLGFKHCANAFNLVGHQSAFAWDEWTKTKLVSEARDRPVYVGARETFLHNAKVFGERKTELEAMLNAL